MFIDDLINSVVAKCSDKLNYYSQAERNSKHGFDCSSLILRSLTELGINHDASYTGDMDRLTKFGFDKIAITPGESFQRGDILVKHIGGSVGHTVLYLGNNKIAEACNSKYGLRVTNYYSNGYHYILRYNQTAAAPVLHLPPMLRQGDKNIYVGLLQLFLNKYNNNRLVIDCEYGPKTADAVANFQTFKNLEIDKIVGDETWSKIYIMMAQN